MTNPYGNPEALGLEIVGTIDWTDEDYHFDMTVVWRDKSGQLYMASDAGCSCPSPFEDFNGMNDLTKVTAHSLGKFLTSRATGYSMGQVGDLMTKVFGNEKYKA